MNGVAIFLLSLAGSVSTVVLLGIVAFLARTWIGERLKASIKHEYDIKRIEVEHQREIRIKGEVVAELLAQWIRANGKLDYYELNRMSFQAFLWLPPELATDLSNTLSHQSGSVDLRALIKRVRTHLQGHDDEFKSKDVIVFSEPTIHQRFKTSTVTSDASVKPKPRA